MWMECIFAFTATISYGILFNVPRKALIGGGFIGMSGWMFVSFLTDWHISAIVASLIASVIVATVSIWLSRLMKLPSTNFSIAGIIPLVPGALAFRTMRGFVAGDYVQAIALATETLLIAGAIAAGLMISLSIFSLMKGMGWRDGAKHP